MIPEYLQTGFEQAKRLYPQAWIKCWGTELDLFEEDEIPVPHTFQLVDAVSASFRTPDREGMLVLQEMRPGNKIPRNHWGFMIAKSVQDVQ
jgi:hypothetical protein